jgi:hypothetical protein
MIRSNAILPVSVIILSSVFIIITFNLPETESTGTVDARVWPLIILSIMLAMGILLAIRTYRQVKAGIENSAEDEPSQANPKTIKPNNHWLMIAILVAYVLAMPVMGFLVATPIFLILLALALGMDRLSYLILTAGITHVAAVVLFIYAFNIPLPRGVGFFRTLSFLIY